MSHCNDTTLLLQATLDRLKLLTAFSRESFIKMPFWVKKKTKKKNNKKKQQKKQNKNVLLTRDELQIARKQVYLWWVKKLDISM